MTRKLLLAEENATIQRIVALTFANEGIDVIPVTDGEEAVARIPVERPDIVLANLATPRRSGYDVATYVKQTAGLSHIPVLLVAGAFEPVDEVRLRTIGCEGVLVKPFDSRQLVARVRELLERPPQPPAAAAAAAGAGERPGAGLADSNELDRYFEQLDAAFASRGKAAPSESARAEAEADDVIARVTEELDEANASVPTIDDILGGAAILGSPEPLTAGPRVAPPPPEPADASPTIAPAAGHPEPAARGSGNPIVDVYRLLFAVEQGERDPGTIRVGASAMATEELVEQVMRRVLDRLKR